MATPDISDNLRQFIFEHVDSLALLEVIFTMRSAKSEWFTADILSRELRTSVDSVTHRLNFLLNLGLLVQNDSVSGQFRYQPKSSELETLITQLADYFKVKPHKVLELIFSPVKRARQFADAFSITKPIKSDEGENG